MKVLLGLVLPILSLPVFSRIWGRIVRIRRPGFLVKKAIKRFQKAYRINMEEFEGDIGDYRSLADFFVRRLNPLNRPLVPDEHAVVSPADGVLTNIETIFTDQATQVKGKTYSIAGLIQETLDFSPGWHVATIYLAPFNYHRYHYPLTGKIKRYLHTGGRLFPVNRLGVNRVRQLFVQNERIILEMEKNHLSCYVAAVGATFVGSIKMECMTPPLHKKRNQWIPLDLEVRQLEEMGRFDIGSTIVMVIPARMAEPIKEKIGQAVKVGEPLFRIP